MTEDVRYHSLPPGVSGDTRGYLILSVDELIWLRDSDHDAGYHVRAGWWGSDPGQQVTFVPVDVRNFVQHGLIMHSYPVKTGQEKLSQYLTDASPLILSLYLNTETREPAGRAYILLDNSGVEGYFPVLTSLEEEIAAVHVKMMYVDNKTVEGEASTAGENPKKAIKPRSKPLKPRVTFPVNVIQQSLEIPSQSETVSRNTKTSKTVSNHSVNHKSEENISFLSTASSSVTEVSFPNKSIQKSNSLSLSLDEVTFDGELFEKIREMNKKQQKNKSKSDAVSSTRPKIFVYAKINFPGARDVTFCSRLGTNDEVFFNETKVVDDFLGSRGSNLVLSNMTVTFGCRLMGCKSNISLGSATIPLRTMLFDEDRQSRILANIVNDSKKVGNFAINVLKGPLDIVATTDEVMIENKENQTEAQVPEPPRLPSKLPLRKPLYQITSRNCSDVSVDAPVFVFLHVSCQDASMSSWANIRMRWCWSGDVSCGLGQLRSQQLVLKPGAEGRIYNRQTSSALLDNYLVLELWRHDQITGIARVPTHSLHTVCQSWSRHSAPVSCFDDLVEIVSVNNGAVIGQFNVQMRVGEEEPSHTVESCVQTVDIDPTDDDVPVMDDDNDDEEDESRHYHTSDDFLNSISHDNDPVPADQNTAVCHIEEVRLSVSSTWVYCSFPSGHSTPVFRSDEVSWDVSVPLAMGDQSQLIIRVWCSADQARPDFKHDKMRGFVSVDCSPLLLGFPVISGWYNIIDWMGQSKGQMKITLKPSDQSAASLPSIQHHSLYDKPSFTQSSLIIQPAALASEEQSPSITIIENKLTKHLEDLNIMTSKLGSATQSFKNNFNMKYFPVSECNPEVAKNVETENKNPGVCDLTLGLIDEYLKMTSFLQPDQPGSDTDRSRIGPEGGNAE